MKKSNNYFNTFIVLAIVTVMLIAIASVLTIYGFQIVSMLNSIVAFTVGCFAIYYGIKWAIENTRKNNSSIKD